MRCDRLAVPDAGGLDGLRPPGQGHVGGGRGDRRSAADAADAGVLRMLLGAAAEARLGVHLGVDVGRGWDVLLEGRVGRRLQVRRVRAEQELLEGQGWGSREGDSQLVRANTVKSWAYGDSTV